MQWWKSKNKAPTGLETLKFESKSEFLKRFRSILSWRNFMENIFAKTKWKRM